MSLAMASLPSLGIAEPILVAALLVVSIVSYAVAWWRILEAKPDPLRTWRSPIARRK